MNAEKSFKAIFLIVVLALAVAGIIWAAGFTFFALSKTNPMGKTDFFTWWVYWQAYKDDPAVAKRLLLALLIPSVAVFGMIGMAVYNSLKERRKLYGEARFANSSEIAKAGLFGSDGIIVGKWQNRFLMFGGMQFVLLAAPTRSGKGVGIVIPNLLNWRDSVVVLDVKQENFLITSGYRARYGQECYLFNPFAEDGRTHRYNPLGYISDNPRLRVNEILAIGYSLYPGEGKDAFFDDAARNLFLGLTLYLCETPTLPRTFGELLRQSSGKGRPVKEYILELITQRNYYEVEEEDEDGELVKVLKPITQWDGEGLPPLSMECVDALNRFTSTSDNTLSSIMATFNVPLTLWASPIFDAATSANDFDLRDVRRKRMSIYLGVPANKLAEARLILNLFFTQLVNLNTDQLLHATPELKYQCLMLMDEFTAPGRIGIIDKANSFMAGYGMRPLTIIQSPGQLEAEPPRGYGRENARTLVTNHACQILYTPREQRDANEYSEMLGYYTFRAVGRSRQLSGRSGLSESESDQKRPLMMPQELKEMSQREQIINVENTKPIKCEKIAYYMDRVFMDRLKEVSPSLRALGKDMPSKSQLERAWGSGELASRVPVIDFDLHRAQLENRVREVTLKDVATTIDLKRMAPDLSRLDVLAREEGISTQDAEAYVNEFFGALDAGWTPEEEADDVDETGAGHSASDEELAALEAMAEAEAAGDEIALELNVGPMTINLDALDQPEPVEAEYDNTVEPVFDRDNEAGEAEAVAGMPADDAEAFGDGYVDLSDFDDMPPEDVPDDWPEEPEDIAEDDDEVLEPPPSAGARPILDLSLLDKPTSAQGQFSHKGRY